MPVKNVAFSSAFLDFSARLAAADKATVASMEFLQDAVRDHFRLAKKADTYDGFSLETWAAELAEAARLAGDTVRYAQSTGLIDGPVVETPAETEPTKLETVKAQKAG